MATRIDKGNVCEVCQTSKTRDEENLDNKIKVDVLKELGQRIREWKVFATILGLEDSCISEIEERFPTADLCIQRNLEVIKKCSHSLSPTTWGFWLKQLQQFEDGKRVIEEMEISFPNLIDEVLETKVLKEIASRVGEWKIFARILGLEVSCINEIERNFPTPSLYIQRNLEVMRKFSHPRSPNPSWEFWRKKLQQFESGKIVIQEMEMNFPNLLAEVSDTGAHKIIVNNFNYVGHPFDYKDIELFAKENGINFTDDTLNSIAVRLASSNFVELQSILKWNDTRKDYANRYTVLQEINSLNFTDIGNINYPILITLKNYLNNTKDSGFVAKGYHFVDHICLLKPGLYAKDRFDDQYFCFIVNDGVVLYITVCSQGKSHALYHSTRNIQIANVLHKELNSNQILQVNVIVHTNDNDTKFCNTCLEDSLYVTEGVFKDNKKFAKWYQDVCKIKPKFKYHTEGMKEKVMMICQSIKNDMFAFEALENTDLPSFSYCPEDQVEDLEKIIVLTPPQVSVLHSNENHIFLRGPYGSGKSLVLEKKFEKFISFVDELDISYLICHDQQSEFYLNMTKMQSKYSHKNIIVCQSKDIVPFAAIPKLSTILTSVKNLWQNRKTHVFIDECIGAYIDETEVKELQNVLTFYSDSHIVVAFQSMEEIVASKEAEVPCTFGYQFDLLSEKTSFVGFKFMHSLRSSYEINEFVKATSRILETSLTEVKSSQSFYSRGKFIDKEFGMENFETEERKDKIAMTTKGNDLKTSYKFNEADDVGHVVKAGPVKVFFLSRSVLSKVENSLSLQIAVLSYILNDASINDKYVVCTYDSDLYTVVAEFLERNSYNWTNIICEFVPGTNYEILLTDYASVRGFEFPNFILMAPLGSEYLRYRMVECLARATTKLFVVTDNRKYGSKVVSINWEKSVDQKLLMLWRQIGCSIFYCVSYNEWTDSLKTTSNGNIILKKQVKNVLKHLYKCSESCDSTFSFPWANGVSLPTSEVEHDGVLAIFKNLIQVDNVNLCREFIKSNDHFFNRYDRLWKANLLKLCIVQNAVDIFKLLIYEHNFEKYFNDFQNRDPSETPLQMAIKYGCLDISRVLIDNLVGRQMDINMLNEEGNSPLHEAVKFNQDGIVNLLLNKDANINVQNNEGNTPLHVALRFCKVKKKKLNLFRSMSLNY